MSRDGRVSNPRQPVKSGNSTEYFGIKLDVLLFAAYRSSAVMSSIRGCLSIAVTGAGSKEDAAMNCIGEAIFSCTPWKLRREPAHKLKLL